MWLVPMPLLDCPELTTSRRTAYTARFKKGNSKIKQNQNSGLIHYLIHT